MKEVILDQKFNAETVNDYDKAVDRAADEHLPRLIEKYGLERVEKADYRIILEVSDSENDGPSESGTEGESGALLLFNKQYDGESLYDFDRDTSEAIMEEYNPLVAQIPTDEHGFQKGTFEVTITWKPDDEQEV